MTNQNEPKIIFMGTPKIGAEILQALLDADYKIDSVVTRPDKPSGRGGQTSESAVKKLAIKNNIKIFQPIKKQELEDFIIDTKPDLIIVTAFGMILPKVVLEVPKFKAINVHPSLLPKYRGPAPIEAPILAGDEKTGTTIMLMSEKMDEGDILLQKDIRLSGRETASELEKKLTEISKEVLLETLPKWISGEISPTPQNGRKATYSKMITKEDGHVVFAKETAQEIERKNRAFSPWPGTFIYWGDKKLDLFGVVENSEKLAPGEINIHDGHIFIGTKKGTISVEELKLEGKNKVTAADFLRGYPDFPKALLK